MIEDRILQRVRVTESGCWEWQGSRTPRGYGKIWVSGPRRCIYVHRAMYEAMRQPISAGLTIDHLCRNPPCCNPDHLEAVTQMVNNVRARKTQCVHGHLFTEANILRCATHPEVRYCRACLTRRRQERAVRERAARDAPE